MTPRLFRAAVPLLIGVLVLPACGRRGNPLPPRASAPAAPGNVAAETRGNAILVSWTRPARNQDGSPLGAIQEFRILRGSGPITGAIRPLVPLASVRAERPDNAQVQDSTYIYRDDGGVQGLQPGTRYRYRVEAVTRGGTVGTASGEAVVDFTAAPAPPTGLVATPGDGVVDLAWQAPLADTAAVTGYNIYRAAVPGRVEPQPVNARPVTGTRFRDAGVKNDVTYAYIVRSVSNARPPWRESADSTETRVTPQDFLPPAPPRGLVAVPTQGSVGLSWDANTEPDILGYVVYRRALPEVTAERLTDAPVAGTTFTDRTARPGVTYLYSITAVDRSAHRNESAPSAEVQASLP